MGDDGWFNEWPAARAKNNAWTVQQRSFDPGPAQPARGTSRGGLASQLLQGQMVAGSSLTIYVGGHICVPRWIGYVRLPACLVLGARLGLGGGWAARLVPCPFSLSAPLGALSLNIP